MQKWWNTRTQCRDSSACHDNKPIRIETGCYLFENVGFWIWNASSVLLLQSESTTQSRGCERGFKTWSRNVCFATSQGRSVPPVILQTLCPLFSLQLRPTTHWSTYTVMPILCRTCLWAHTRLKSESSDGPRGNASAPIEDASRKKLVGKRALFYRTHNSIPRGSHYRTSLSIWVLVACTLSANGH